MYVERTKQQAGDGRGDDGDRPKTLHFFLATVLQSSMGMFAPLPHE